MGKLTKFEKALISAGLEAIKLQQAEENERIRAKGNNPIFGDNNYNWDAPIVEEAE